jgi:DNA-binding transcriptional LysR family regulator
VPRDLVALRKRAPALRVELKAMSSAAQAAALQSGALDLGYAYSPALPDSGLSSRMVHEEGFLLAAPRDLALKGRELPIAALNATPLITMPESLAPRARPLLLAALAKLGIAPHVQVEASDPAILLALVSAHVGFAVLQSSLRALMPRAVRWLPLPRRFELRMQVHVMRGSRSPPWAPADQWPVRLTKRRI